MSSPSKSFQKQEEMQKASSKKIFKATSQNNTNTNRKMVDVTKRLDNVEYMIKIEDKNKKQLAERYEKQIQKTEKLIVLLEAELKAIIKELNEKEAKIYEIQKVKFDSFKEDISKFEQIYLDLEEKQKQLLLQISELKIRERITYNQTFMLNEECASTRNEITTVKRKIGDLKENMEEIERSYPKEFEFLLEDIKLEKELLQIKQQKSKQ
jgi:chromosome segregation ATPase